MKVSICIPAYNAESTISDTLQSIVAQTYEDLDVAVVDNASTDRTAAIVREFAAKDSRVRLVRFEELVHSHDNFTRCFGVAQNDLMAIYHADDVYRPRIVEQQVAAMEKNPDVGAVFTRGDRIDVQGNRMSEPFGIPKAIFEAGDCAIFNFEKALHSVFQYGHIFLTPSGMARTRIYRDEIGRWPNPEFGGSADLYVFLTIARKHKLMILNKTLMDYRVSAASYSFNYVRVRRTAHDIFKTLDYFLDKDASLIGPRDLSNYEFLKLKDDLNLAINGLIDGRNEIGRRLMPRLLHPRIIAAAFRWRRHAKFLLYAYCVWILSLVPIGPAGRKMLFKARFG